MCDKWLQKPRQLILSEISRFDLRNPEQTQVLKPRIDKRISLPPLHNQTDCRRIKTQPNTKETIHHQGIKQFGSVLKFTRSQVLTELTSRLPSLQELALIEGGAVRTIRYSGHIRIPTVHNDYHSSKTNAGYSRNKYGGIYPK